MKLHLTGRHSPDQIATRWMLRARGYTTTCTGDAWNKNDALNGGSDPTVQQARRNALVMMLEADAVLVDPEAMTTAEIIDVLQVCRHGGLRCLRMDDLPAVAPLLPVLVHRLVHAKDLVAASTPAPRAARPSVRERLAHLRRLAHQLRGLAIRLERGFNTRFGWFLTNGRKAANAAELHGEA